MIADEPGGEAGGEAGPAGERWMRVEPRVERLDRLFAVLDRPFVIERPAELRDLTFAGRLTSRARRA